MKARVSTILTAAVSLLALPAAAQHAGEDEGLILLTDPIVLESLGLAPDAQDVYATANALAQLEMDPEAAAVAQEELIEEPAGSPYGTSTTGYTVVDRSSFRPVDYQTQYFFAFGGNLQCVNGDPNSTFEAQIESLPHGARLTGGRSWYWDSSSANDLTITVYRTCHPDSAPGNATTTILGNFISSGTGGVKSNVFAFDTSIDLHSCVYIARVKLGNSGCAGLGLGFSKLRLAWRRQVTPAPGTATFSDVPTSHPFFRHIEALAASGITSGCGDGSRFCPGAQVTRAQMAVYLATALGLHWGEF